MRHLTGYLLMVVGLAIVVPMVLLIVLPLVPYAIGGLLVGGAFRMLYYRKRRW